MNSASALKAAKTVKDPDKRKALLRRYRELQVRETIQTCEKCPLHEKRRNAVPWSGPTNGDIGLVGEAPGVNEDRVGIPFKGKAGRLLDKTLGYAGLNRDDIFVFNTICCRPPGNRNPRPEEKQACRDNFDAQLNITSAWLIMVAGNAALESTLGWTGISRYRGKPVWTKGRLWFPIKHPAYYLRNRKMTSELTTDLLRVHDIVRGAERVQVDLREWPLTIEGTASELAEAIRKQGWAYMWSTILEDKIAIVRDEKVKRPHAIRGLPTYSLDELVRVRMLGQARKLGVKDLKRIHAAKKAFDGVIVQ